MGWCDTTRGIKEGQGGAGAGGAPLPPIEMDHG